MKRNLWALVTLESYKKLVDMCDALDATVDSIIKQSYDGRKDAYTIMQKIQDINYRKAGLINLKVIFEQTIKKLKDNEKVLLYNIFCKGKKIADYANENDLCVRTLRRRFNTAVCHFGDKLACAGYNDEWFNANYNDEPYIMLISERISERLQKHRCKILDRQNKREIKSNGEVFESKDNRVEMGDDDINIQEDNKSKLITILQDAVLKMNSKVAN